MPAVFAPLESSLALYRQAAPGSIEQEVFRNAIVKGYELTQETSFKLLKRVLKDFGHGGTKLDATPVKDILRLAATHGIMTLEEVERWFTYRANRNTTAHDYGEGFAKETLLLLPSFVTDVTGLECVCAHDSTTRTGCAMKTLATDALHLPAAYLSMVRDILSRHMPVWAYGSRVTGTGHNTSDLDLVLRNPARLDEETGNLGALTDAFSEGNLPIRVDLTDWARIPEHVRQEIARTHVVVQPGTPR